MLPQILTLSHIILWNAKVEMIHTPYAKDL
jgi:hypothetical protein